MLDKFSNAKPVLTAFKVQNLTVILEYWKYHSYYTLLDNLLLLKLMSFR